MKLEELLTDARSDLAYMSCGERAQLDQLATSLHAAFGEMDWERLGLVIGALGEYANTNDATAVETVAAAFVVAVEWHLAAHPAEAG